MRRDAAAPGLMLIRIAFALVALVCLREIASTIDLDAARIEPSALLVFLVPLTVLSVGMAVPWRRLAPRLPPPPGRSLAFLSKLAGWGGACYFPILLGLGHPLAAGVLLVLFVSSVALWLDHRWARWSWIAIAAGCFALGAAGLWIAGPKLWSELRLGWSTAPWIMLTRVVWLSFPFVAGASIVHGLRARRFDRSGDSDGAARA